MSVVEDRYAGTQVSDGIDALIATTTSAWVLSHARAGPPKAAAPGQIAFGHGIANVEILGRADYRRAFEPWFRRKINSRHSQIIAAIIGMNAKEVAVKPVTNQVAVELPHPSYSVVEA